MQSVTKMTNEEAKVINAIRSVPTTSPTGECDPLGCNRPCGRCATRVWLGDPESSSKGKISHGK